MIFLRENRSPYPKNNRKHLISLEKEEFLTYKKVKNKQGKEFLDIEIINGKSDELIYLAEEDFVFKIVNLEEKTISFAPKFTGRKEEFKLFDEQGFPEIHFSYLKKLVKNFYIKNDNNREAILKRDQNMCQLCGFNDTHALEMHHIVSKKSPFMIEEFIHSPLNLITLCANCHSIQHHIMRNETEEVREKKY